MGHLKISDCTGQNPAELCPPCRGRGAGEQEPGSRSQRSCISRIKVATRPRENFSMSNVSVKGSGSTTTCWCFRCTTEQSFAFQKRCLLCHGKLACHSTAYQPQYPAELADSTHAHLGWRLSQVAEVPCDTSIPVVLQLLAFTSLFCASGTTAQVKISR